MPKDMPADIHVKAIAGRPVELPSGHFIANAEMTRVGQDLHLTANGHTVVVQGYFALGNPPELVSHDGAHLSPAMVDAFVPPQHAGQYASSGQIATDTSPAGRITQVVGKDEIIRADGTHVIAAVGTPVYQGDIVQTSKTGALNILFSDHTTFAVSESARLSIDKYVYHSDAHTGSTFFSMLQGMFVYTSGLIGKTQPGNVNIETPVGSIGIRGTVIAGHIFPAGHPSDITIVNGAITVTNGSGTIDMSNSFQTVAIDSYHGQPQPVAMDAPTFSADYSSLGTVAADTLHHFVSMAPAAAPAAAPDTTVAPATDHTTTAPATTAPPATEPAPTAAPAESGTTSSSTTTTAAPTTTTVTSTTDVSTAPATTAATTSFTTTTTGTTGSFGTTGTSSFNTTSTGTTGTTGTTTTTAPSTSSGATTTTTTTTTTTATAPAPAFGIQLAVDSGYSNSDHITNDSALQALNLAATAVTIQYAVESGSAWNAAGASWSATQGMLADGNYVAEARELDANNNVLGTSGPLAFTLDATAPTLTNVTNATATDANNQYMTNESLSATLHFSEAMNLTAAGIQNVTGSTPATIVVDSVVNNGYNTISHTYDYTVTYHATSAGNIQIQVGGQDLAGNAVTGSDTIQPTALSVHDIELQFSPGYTKGTATTGDDGLSQFTPNGTAFGKIQVASGIAVDHYSVITTGQEYTTGGAVQTISDPGNTVFSVDASGNLVVDNYLALATNSAINAGGSLNITIEAFNTGGTMIDSISRTVLLNSDPALTSGTPTVGLGNLTGGFLISTDTAGVTLTGTTGADMLVGGSGSDTLIGNGGQDVLLGEGGNDTLQVLDASFLSADGGGGVNTLDIGGSSAA
ncbi:MAG: hypothetical protein KGQ70_05645, partial [Alphaproteobacteria bacterium]|nr:hypothetical protein [Alphaproteobacteria bacterium]